MQRRALNITTPYSSNGAWFVSWMDVADLQSLIKAHYFDQLVTKTNPRLRRFNRWLLYFKKWSGTVKKERLCVPQRWRECFLSGWVKAGLLAQVWCCTGMMHGVRFVLCSPILSLTTWATGQKVNTQFLQISKNWPLTVLFIGNFSRGHRHPQPRRRDVYIHACWWVYAPNMQTGVEGLRRLRPQKRVDQSIACVSPERS